MKKRPLLIFALALMLCLLSAPSKECGKIVGDKATVEGAEKKTATQKKNNETEDIQTEFSLIHTLFFQTT